MSTDPHRDDQPVAARRDPRAASASCPSCGGELSRDGAVAGLCPGCLAGLALDAGSEAALQDEAVDPTDGPDLLAAGQVLGGRYRLRGLLGRGGMGDVWLADDLKLRVEVALKSLRRKLLSHPEALRSLREEVRMARQVVSANVCRVFDLVEVAGRELLSMEYVDGVTLQRLLEERGPLDLTEARQLAAQLLAGLEAIHQAGLVHRDLKPENIMVTRAGRVVLMDFGIARSSVRPVVGALSGTPVYMAPEQRRGAPPSPASDVYSAGVVLAEMLAAGAAAGPGSRRAVWQGILRQPPEVPQSPWAPVILQAVARQPERRHPGAAALARALDELTLRTELSDDVRPYPGLAAFTASDAGFFFGRELEVEELWRKLRQPHLLGLVGPSGAGKSSFLRAGLVPAAPPGWGTVLATPGAAPVANLALALAPELAEDEPPPEVPAPMLEPVRLLERVRRWRRRHEQALVVLDQFEELFTLNPPEVRAAFARLLADLVLDADVHVLVALRDDFLFRCAEHAELAPLFSDLTPLRPPSPAALRRALIQPALRCGFRFEDDALVGEMVAEVGDERGALPLLAFAAARLWELRDRTGGVLTREAYRHIGGVGGALAQHAESTLASIGLDRAPLVRELLRHLMTAQGTRVARPRSELLSVFGPDGDRAAVPADDRLDAERVLDGLVEARLLTSYEVAAREDGEPPRQMVEVIHESLLIRWPRLVRWRAQDEDGALLRDQLRQSARLWHERGRPEDLLWSGTSYRELCLWRERDSGGLSALEADFASATTARAERSRRRRRRLAATIAVVLLVALGGAGLSWWRARRQALRAEANQLLALGEAVLEDEPTGALAFALASLERADEQAARLLAVDALQRGPPALYLEGAPQAGGRRLGSGLPLSVDLSPDGTWLATGTGDGRVRLWHRSGGSPKEIQVAPGNVVYVRFGPTSDVVFTRSYPSQRLQAWSIDSGRLLRTLPVAGPLDFRIAMDARRVFTFRKAGAVVQVESWPAGGGEPTTGPVVDGALDEWSKYYNPWNIEIDPAGRTLAFAPYDRRAGEHAVEPTVLVLDAAGTTRGAPRLVGHHAAPIGGLTFDHDGRRLASVDERGEVRIWDLESVGEGPERILHHPPGLVRHLRFGPQGRWLVAASFNGHTALWDLAGPPGAGPMIIAPHGSNQEADFDPAGEWLATAGVYNTALRPLGGRHPVDLHGHGAEVTKAVFLPDGRRLVSVSHDGTVRLWSLSAAGGDAGRIVFDAGVWLQRAAVSPSGQRLLVVTVDGAVWLVPLVGQESPRLLGAFNGNGIAVALGEDVAIASGDFFASRSFVRIWDLATGEARDVPTGDDPILDMTLTADGRLVTSDWSGLRLWDVQAGTATRLSDSHSAVATSGDGHLLLVGLQGAADAAVVFDLDDGSSVVLAGRGPSESGLLDAAGEIAVTVPASGGPVRVGRVAGGPVHVIPVEENVRAYALSPDARWLATLSDGDSSVIHLHPLPDVSRPALDSLPHDQLVARLRRLTNLRVRLDPGSDRGWRWQLAPFPGWQEVPAW